MQDSSRETGFSSGVSFLGTLSLEDVRRIGDGSQPYQFYFRKDRGLNREMMNRAKQDGSNVVMLTVDCITGGNPERDKPMGCAISFTSILPRVSQFAVKPGAPSVRLYRVVLPVRNP